MIKKNLCAFLFFSVILLLNSCWIYPDYKEYEVIDNTYYFDDYETMKSVIIPMINTSFKDWHWNGEEFDVKYNKYFGNIAANEDDYKNLKTTKYKYAVRNPKSVTAKIDNSPKEVTISESYWISTADNKAVIFFQN